MKIFITGGAGFISKWLVRNLPQEAEIILVDSLDPQVHKDQAEFITELRQRATCIKADIRDPDAYVSAMEGTDVFLHLAAQTGTGQSMYEMSRYVQQNVEGTAKLLEAINGLKQKPRRIILTSSRAVYGEGAFTDGSNVIYSDGRSLEDLQAGRWEIFNRDGQELRPLPMKEEYLANPTSVYGLTKLWQEQLIENYAKNQKIDYAIFRLQNVYGPEQALGNPYTGIIGIFTSSIVQKGKVELFEDGEMTRDFVYANDVATALVEGIYYQDNLSKTINVGSGIATSLTELVNLIAKISGKKVAVNYSGRFRIGDIRHAVADMSQYKSVFGAWQPTSLEQGLRKYWEWYIEQDPLSEGALSASLKEMEDNKLLLQREQN
ncbi:MAG: NAD-dependent epimerase/dehydratase family protein [Cyanobacteriota bacterium]|nr:NAD-dependent epimerase/dehydratase family protein [Cyanobacteriota bacterium]